jgi:hypothetical protein
MCYFPRWHWTSPTGPALIFDFDLVFKEIDDLGEIGENNTSVIAKDMAMQPSRKIMGGPTEKKRRK